MPAVPDELNLALALDYKIDGLDDEEALDIVDEAVREQARRLAAALADDLESRGVEGIRIRIEGD